MSKMSKISVFCPKTPKTSEMPSFIIVYLDSLLKTTQEFLFHKKFGGTKKKIPTLDKIIFAKKN